MDYSRRYYPHLVNQFDHFLYAVGRKGFTAGSIENSRKHDELEASWSDLEPQTRNRFKQLGKRSRVRNPEGIHDSFHISDGKYFAAHCITRTIIGFAFQRRGVIRAHWSLKATLVVKLEHSRKV